MTDVGLHNSWIDALIWDIELSRMIFTSLEGSTSNRHAFSLAYVPWINRIEFAVKKHASQTHPEL
jgi:hypothetical protein